MITVREVRSVKLAADVVVGDLIEVGGELLEVLEVEPFGLMFMFRCVSKSGQVSEFRPANGVTVVSRRVVLKED